MFEAVRQFKGIFILIGVGVITTILIGIILMRNSQPTPPPSTQPTPTPTQGPSQTSQTDRIGPLQKTYPGVTSAESVKQLDNIIDSRTREDGGIEYDFSSVTQLRNNTIITSEDMVVFERIIPTTSGGNPPQFSEMKIQYGTAEHIRKGAASYGEFIETHIYASRGFAFVVNPLIDRVYEIHVFIPTTVDGYLSRWGQDITSYKEPEEHL